MNEMHVKISFHKIYISALEYQRPCCTYIGLGSNPSLAVPSGIDDAYSV